MPMFPPNPPKSDNLNPLSTQQQQSPPNQKQSPQQQNSKLSDSPDNQMLPQHNPQSQQQHLQDPQQQSQDSQKQLQGQSQQYAGQQQQYGGQQLQYGGQQPQYGGQQPQYGGQQPQHGMQDPFRPPSYGAVQNQQQQYGNQPPGTQVVYIQPANEAPMYRSGKRPPEEPPRPGENDATSTWETFSDLKVRRVFVRKVYLILTMQLIFTFATICLFIFEPNVKKFVRTHPALFYVALGVFFVVFLALACIESLRRKHPINIIMLIIFTLAMSYLMGTISSLYKTDIVLMAVGVCAIVCFVTTVFSFFTKLDFTSCGGILCILLIILLIFGLIAIFVRSKIMSMIYAGFGALLFTMYLAYDTQLIMGGKQAEISPEEYVFAALMLYIDIIYIYMFLLMLFGYSN